MPPPYSSQTQFQSTGRAVLASEVGTVTTPPPSKPFAGASDQEALLT
jgi:hypothetical protein